MKECSKHAELIAEHAILLICEQIVNDTPGNAIAKPRLEESVQF